MRRRIRNLLLTAIRKAELTLGAVAVQLMSYSNHLILVVTALKPRRIGMRWHEVRNASFLWYDSQLRLAFGARKYILFVGLCSQVVSAKSGYTA